MRRYIHHDNDWPTFAWDEPELMPDLLNVRYRQGYLIGSLQAVGFQLQEEATLETLTLDVIKSSEIEGERLPLDQVRSSLARRLGVAVAGLVPSGRNVDGVVEMMLDATQQYAQPLTRERLFGWHAALFPNGHSGMDKITVGAWRTDSDGPMQVVSGPMGKERVHFEAPAASRLDKEMTDFLAWFNTSQPLDPVMKAALAHFWFVTIHPFDDGNGRIARAIADMQLARADGSPQRFYSMSAQIQKERSDYYATLEKTQRGGLDITPWLLWFFGCLERTIVAAKDHLANVVHKTKFWDEHKAAAFNDRQRTMLNKLMDSFDGKLNTSKWAKMMKCSPDTALRDIMGLVEAGVLEKEPGGGRSTSYRLTARPA